MVSATTMDSITWTWNAVEGALGYAVQVSHDEMFDDTDMTHPTTETTFTASDLEPETSVFVRVRAAAGTVEAPLVSAWTTHVTGMSAMPPPPPPAPMAAPTPTGLMSESGDGSITWSWEAVDGADGYAVQVSMDEMFDDMDETMYPMETSHTVEDLDYSETRFARVASTSGVGDDMLMSMWTTHVTGMSNAEPPPPPPPAVSVTFSLSEEADSAHFMIADADDDEKTAMAMVNPEIMVESNTTALITPMFVENAAGVSIDEGSDNMPFSLVDWSTLQSGVISDGATFMIQRTSMGANQEMEPSNDVAYVTCGPFSCAEGMDAPAITIDNSEACMAWDPTLELQVGLIDNNLDSHAGRAYVAAGGDNPDTTKAETDFAGVVEVAVYDGLDLGWHYTSSLDVDITHDLAVTSAETKGVKKKSSATPLAVPSAGAITLGRVENRELTAENQKRYYALSAEGEDDGDGTRTAGLDKGSCQPVSDEDLWAYNDNVASRVSRPDNCFRVTVDSSLNRNYLDAYTVTMAPKGADVTWGKIDWWEDADDMTCETRTVKAAEQVDVCAMFEEEVDRLPDPTAIPVVMDVSSGATGLPSNIRQGTGETGDSDGLLVGFNLEYEDAAKSRHRFTAMWYNRKTEAGKDEKPPPNLYENVAPGEGDDAFDETNIVTGADGGMTAWVKTVDDDYDPIYSDLGKVSLDGDDEADNFMDGDDSRKCTASDGGSAATGKEGADDNSTLCDAEDVPIETTVSFPLGLGYGCDAVEKTYTLTCQWSSRGNRTNSVGSGDVGMTAENVGDFVKCEVE